MIVLAIGIGFAYIAGMARIRRTLLVVVGATLLLLVAAAGACFWATRTFEVPISVDASVQAPGALCKAEQVGTYPATFLRVLRWWASPPESIPISCGIKIYRLRYRTTHHDGTSTMVSGLVAFPTRGTPRAVVSYQHGTNTNRHTTPSQPSPGEGLLGAALFAGNGYVFTAPDYIGLGSSTEVHPYLHAASTANAVVDLLRATHAFAGQLKIPCPQKILLTGFSQGGHATMAAHRALESLHDPLFQVIASAPVAGPYDLAGISFPATLNTPDRGHSLYLAYLVNAYCTIYGHDPDSVFIGSWAKRLPILFDGEHDAEIVEGFPENPREMFTKTFLDDYDQGRPTWLSDALVQNEVIDWTPKAPLRAYYGENDRDVPPEESRMLVSRLSQRGCNATLVSVGPYEHDASVLHAVPRILAWFNELTAR